MKGYKPKENIADTAKKELPVASGAGGGRDPTETIIFGEKKRYDPTEFGEMYENQTKEKKKYRGNEK